MTGATPIADGTPLRDLAPIDQQVRRLAGPGLLFAAGISTEVAHLVAAETGEPVTWPFATLGLVDGDERCRAFVIVRAGSDYDAELIAFDGGLPWSRAAVLSLARYLFDRTTGLGLASVIVRARPTDAATIAFLARLGFVACGRDDRPGGAARLVFSIDRDTAIRRACSRPNVLGAC